MKANLELSKKHLREFGLVTSAMVVVLFGLLLPWLFGLNFPTWPWLFAATMSSLALLAPSSLGGVYRVWMRFGLLMSKVTTPIIMGLVFLVAILPAALIMKIIGRDALRKDLDPNATTYKEASEDLPKERLQDPY
ncbi:MAG: sxtJ [Pseudomonadales bacterium]|nr:sxtJ [Pseudomonadales bacterium]